MPTSCPFSEPLWSWMAERHRVYERRAAGQSWPWTTDPILQQYRFCNVFRELDRVTVWIRKNIREPYADHENLWFMLAIARYVNWPDTLQELMDRRAWPSEPAFSPKNLGYVLQDRKDRGEQVYTGAYMIRAESDPRTSWYSWGKQRYVAEVVLGNLWRDRDLVRGALGGSLQVAHSYLTRYYGWGPFMSYEVVTDLRHTRYLRAAPDVMTWASAGPGALRGLQRLRDPEGRRTGRLPSQEEALGLMQQLLEEAPERLPDGFPALEMRDIEHSLCEVDKYLRVKFGEGRPRAGYTPS